VHIGSREVPGESKNNDDDDDDTMSVQLMEILVM
jgi:hypothetical protein